jgi:membrane carboxypeptidase/penicillin-binding protein
MNIKLLKFIVIFFGILIALSLIVLILGIYHKLNNLKKNDKLNNITLKLEKNSKLEDFYIINDNIIIKYKLDNRDIINIYDLFSGTQIKKIELLK